MKFLKKHAVIQSLTKEIKSSPTRNYVIDINDLTKELSELPLEKAKLIFHIIQSYRESNTNCMKVFSDSDETPYGCIYDPKTNSTRFYLNNLPSDLIILLNTFIKNNK